MPPPQEERTNPANPGGAHAPAQDATAEFFQMLNDPTRWVIKSAVPVFKQHQRTDPATGQLIKVDVPKLYRIAANMQRMEKHGGVPVRLTLGHTEPGKPETQQPPIGGYYRNARVQPFGPKGEPAVVVDEWLDPQYASLRKNFPYRSAEYYDDTEQITGVALLARDPYLDLGVVAYSRGDALVTYTKESSGRPPASGQRRPVMYQLVLGEVPMPAPSAPSVPDVPVPTPYGTWPATGSDYSPRQTIPHQHTSTGAVYASPGGLPGGMAGGPPFGPGTPPADGFGAMNPAGGLGGDESGLHALHHHLGKAVEHLSRYLSGRRKQNYAPGSPVPPAAPTGPFPGMGGMDDPLAGGPDADLGGMGLPGGPAGAMGGLGGVGGGPGAGLGGKPPGLPGTDPLAGAPGMGTADQPYSRTRPGQQRPGQPARRYQRQPVPSPGVPTVPPTPQRTISGLPVGYQMKVDQLQYQLNQANQAIQVLYYERDQADTQACVEAIRRLAAQGYDVGDWEVQELKKQPHDQRNAYLDRISAKYQRVGTDVPPVGYGDPTPGPNPGAPGSGPATREEMEAALKLSASDPGMADFTKALHYIRSGGGRNGLPPVRGTAADPASAAWGDAAPAPGGAFTDPYETPSQNGTY